MRIQHNIPAMNSLSSYARNNSALAKNLEKLSSGYRINSAADDAAGLAISEKMRSQIAGLEKAQDNANDGISLVQVAEGALTEVNSMLTRLTELATQSANGTYENEVDRANIQEETNAILEEIDRISKATNFNGINLLDGSMSSEPTEGAVKSIAIPGKGALQGDLGAKTIVHEKGVTAAKTTFDIDLHDFTFNNKTGETLSIDIGGGKLALTLAGDGNGELNGTAIATAIQAANNTVTIDGQTFNVSDEGNGRLKFEQDVEPTKSDEVVNGDMTVKVMGADATATKGATSVGISGTSNAGATKATIAYKDASGAAQTATIDFTSAGAAVGDINALKTALTGDATISGLFTVTAEDSTGGGGAVNSLKFEAKTVGDSNQAQITGITFSGAGAGALAASLTGTGLGYTAGTNGNPAGSGTYNVSTTAVTNGAAPSADKLASTSFDLTKAMVGNGASITIGKETYVFKTGSESVSGGTVVDISMYDSNSASYLSDVATKLTEAAAGNTAFTVGHNGTGGKITVAEKVGQTAYSAEELDTVDEIAALLSQKEASKIGGTALKLQVGDTNDDWQHVAVDIKDMSSNGLGIAGLKLNTQEDAGKAIDTIKAAVNAVSMQRGKLGALQNRLDHTLNNLDATTTNITASESQIRDVNMAKEMTAYTKNNILAQAAQSMLAQANSMPQGVLQLLQ